MHALTVFIFCVLSAQLSTSLPAKAPPSLNELFRDEDAKNNVRSKRNNDDVEPTDSDQTENMTPESNLDVANLVDDLTENERHKKHATFLKVNSNCGKTPCVPVSEVRPPPQDVILVQKLEEPEPMRYMPTAAGRTLDPTYSYGGSPGSGHSPGLQIHAVLPYALHPPQRPMYNNNNNNAYNSWGYSRQPNVVYYNAPEPLYVPTPEHSYHSHEAESVPMYCHPMKSGETSEEKTLPQSADNATAKENQMDDHMKRVNQIKDEISQLNEAAQKIVDQQDELARLQQEQMMAKSGYGPMRYNDPYMRYHEDQMRFPPPYYHSRPYNPYSRSAEPSQTQDQKGILSSEAMMRQMYGDYGSYRSETGFPVPPFFSRAASPTQEQIDLFMKMFSLGKNIGSPLEPEIKKPQSFPQKKEDGPIKSENALTDLMDGGAKEDKPEIEKETSPTKRDLKGIAFKKKI